MTEHDETERLAREAMRGATEYVGRFPEEIPPDAEWQREATEAIASVFRPVIERLEARIRMLVAQGERDFLDKMEARGKALAAEQHLGNLLARIHRDGGHYQSEHGTEKAVEQADWIVVTLLTRPTVEEHEALRARLPEGMEHCMIKYFECEKGHGSLTADNWVLNPCPWCLIEAKDAASRTLAALLNDDIDAAQIRTEAMEARALAAEKALGIAEATQDQIRERAETAEQERDALRARVEELEASIRASGYTWMLATSPPENPGRVGAFNFDFIDPGPGIRDDE